MPILSTTGQGSTHTTTTLSPAQQLQQLQNQFQGGGGGAGSNPLSTTNEDALTVTGIGTLLGLNWGSVSVATAINGFNQLAKRAQHDINAKAKLVQLQDWMYQAGAYGSKKPKLGVLTTGEDDKAFRSMAVAAAQSGTDASTYFPQAAGDAINQGTAGGGTHIIPARVVPEKQWAPIDILAAVNAATTVNGENLAQKLIGRNFTPAELQSIADQMNVAQSQITAADVAGQLQQQQENVATSQAVYGAAPAQAVMNGALSPQQVYSMVIQQGGNATQAMVAGGLVYGNIESGGNPTAKNPKSTASGLFQFLTSTWAGYGGTAFAPTAAQATPTQQVQVFINATKSGYFGDWGPDLGLSYGQQGGPQPGSKVANAIAASGLSDMSRTQAASGKPNNPAPTLKQGRTDQGVDYSGAGNLYPTGAGTVVHVQNSGWGSLGNAGLGALIAIKLDNPPDPAHSVVYYAENIIPNVKQGQHVVPGQVIGRATGKGGGIEIGFADPRNPQNPLAPLNPRATGASTTEGSNFASWLSSGTISAVGAGGAQGTTTDVYQTPIVNPVPSTTGLNAADYATAFAENSDSPDYQKTNLLRIFQQVEDSLKTPPTPNAKVRQTPISMKPGVG